MWLSGDRVRRRQGFVTVGSCRYTEWQNGVLQPTTDVTSEEDVLVGDPTGPMVDYPQYDPLLKRPAAVSNQVVK
ncbi:hypothetical protein L917_21742 [Phytophthora nicotianae]|uniref:Uncharacterized protein n=1 Tax=Phytophthora nicotianae TaxID=4792 RepID=W2JWS0_PHYNI|nr:hypothetical protein L917_21742 [Phytophthora nicotianae]